MTTESTSAQQKIVVLDENLRNPFHQFQQDTIKLKNDIQPQKDFLIRVKITYPGQQDDPDIKLAIGNAQSKISNAEVELKKLEIEIKPIEESIKRIIEDSKDKLVVWRIFGQDISPYTVFTETYSLKDDRIHVVTEPSELKPIENR